MSLTLVMLCGIGMAGRAADVGRCEIEGLIELERRGCRFCSH